MAKRERIKKLAKRLGVDADLAIRTLVQLGETKYRTSADMIPADVAIRLEQALKLAGIASEPPPRVPTPAPVSASAPPAAAPTFVPEPFEDDGGPPPDPEAEVIAAKPDKPSKSKAPAASAADAEGLSASPFAGIKEVVEVVAPPPAEAPTAAVDPAEELERVRGQLKEAQRDLADAKKRAADAEDAWRAHDQGRKIVVSERDDLEQRLSGIQSDLKATKRGRDKDREGHESQIRKLKQDVEDARTTPLRELFEGRGLEHPDEFGQALEFLLEEERSGPTVRSLRVQFPDKFEQKLKKRLMLWCGDGGCITDHPENARIEVSPPARCEACKGKTIRRAAAAFVGACQNNTVLRVTIAGGSPNYRTAIQDAIGGGANLDVRVVLNGERNSTQAQADVEHSELVIAWVATEVDHKFTGLYTHLKSDRVLLCPHRGISRMFEFATEHIKAGKAAATQVAAPPV